MNPCFLSINDVIYTYRMVRMEITFVIFFVLIITKFMIFKFSINEVSISIYKCLIPLMCYGDALALFFPFKWKELLGSLCFRRGGITYMLGEFRRN